MVTALCLHVRLSAAGLWARLARLDAPPPAAAAGQIIKTHPLHIPSTLTLKFPLCILYFSFKFYNLTVISYTTKKNIYTLYTVLDWQQVAQFFFFKYFPLIVFLKNIFSTWCVEASQLSLTFLASSANIWPGPSISFKLTPYLLNKTLSVLNFLYCTILSNHTSSTTRIT